MTPHVAQRVGDAGSGGTRCPRVGALKPIFKSAIVNIRDDCMTLYLTAHPICARLIATKLNKLRFNVYLMKHPDYYCATVTCHPAPNIR
jgi:hypothetical protein